jgi:hypothetical protein
VIWEEWNGYVLSSIEFDEDPLRRGGSHYFWCAYYYYYYTTTTTTTTIYMEFQNK